MRILYFLCIMAFSFGVNASITLHCPADLRLPCTAQTNNLMAYGDAYLMKHGVKYSAGLAHVEYNLNSCNVGTITRKWQAEDENWKIIECKQTIYFEAGVFTVHNIDWPDQELHLEGCDTDLDPENLPEEYDEPDFDYIRCTSVGTSYDDRNFEFGPDCSKILREWTVIDWCNYKPGGNVGIWKYSQTFKLSNDEDPLLSCGKELVVETNECDSIYVEVLNASVEGNSCTNGYNVINNSPYAILDGIDASGVYPIGTTSFLYKVQFGCGKEMGCETKVTVIDNKKPVPYCLSSITVALMPVDTDADGQVDDGMVEVWAKDLNRNSFHPCHNGLLDFSFSSDIEDMVRGFTCENVGVNNVEMWVTDEYGKQSFCRVHVIVQNNASNIPDCEPTNNNFTIAQGTVYTVEDQAIEEVVISFNELDSEPTKNGGLINRVTKVVTNELGQYDEAKITYGKNFRVNAYKEGNLSQVTEEDVTILEDYIKGVKSFSSPYTYLAADINGDRKVDIEDFHLLKNLLGKSEDAWPNQMQCVFYCKPEFDAMSDSPLDDNLPTYEQLIGVGVNGYQTVDFVVIYKGNLDYYESL